MPVCVLRNLSCLVRPVVVATAAVAVLTCVMFGDVMDGCRTFAFRDSAHYYYPLFQWARDEWAAGRVPLWNPLENGGVAVLAETSSSVLYPGKLLFALPLDFALLYNWYIIAHVLLAAAGGYLLARRVARAAPAAAGTAAVAYAFGGNVLFQYCNVVFLVGAAWLPFALWAAHGLLRRRRARFAVALGVVLALMVLGGDPQAAYHSGLIAIGYGALLGWRARRRAGRRSADSSTVAVPRTRWRRRRLVLLAGAAVLGGGLAAVQLLPAMALAGASSRVVFDRPRSVYEVPATLAVARRSPTADSWSRIRDGLFGRPRGGTHQHHIYQFSVGPWRMVEWLWPNASGRLFPRHQRWIIAIPAEGRVWTPSLYTGLLPLVLGLAAVRWLRGPVWVRWLSWVGTWGVVGALGWHGVGWLFLELQGAGGGGNPEWQIGPGVGGVYWLMVLLLPGYAYFRYPAKLLVPAALALCVLAAGAIQRWSAAVPRRVRGSLVVVSGASGVAALLTLLVRPWWSDWLAGVPADPLFGPLDADAAWLDLCRGTLHAAVLAGLVLLVLTRVRSPVGRRIVLLLLTTAELALAQSWLVVTAPSSLWRQPPVVTTAVGEPASAPAERVFRAGMHGWQPPRFAESASDMRMGEIIAWDHSTLFPKFHLLSQQPTLEAFGSLQSYSYQAVWSVARQRGFDRGNGIREPHPDVMSAFGVRYMLLPEQAAAPANVERLPLPHAPVANLSVWNNPDCFPRAWLVDRVEWLAPLPYPLDRVAVERRTRDVFFPNNRVRNLAGEAVVEVPRGHRPSGLRTVGKAARRLAGTRRGQVEVVGYSSDRITLDVDAPDAGLVVISDSFDPGWTAVIAARQDGPVDGAYRSTPIWRTNRVMRGVPVPAGKSRIVMRYRPRAVIVGAAVSAIAWTAVLLWGLVACVRSNLVVRFRRQLVLAFRRANP